MRAIFILSIATINFLCAGPLYANDKQKKNTSYDIGKYHVQEFRSRTGLEKVEVKSQGSGYTLRSKQDPWQKNKELDIPLFEIRSW